MLIFFFGPRKILGATSGAPTSRGVPPRRWKIDVEMAGGKPDGVRVRAVDAVFLTLSEAAAMRPRLIEKLSDVWWK